METLVLNVSYEPVARVTWQRAVTLLWEGNVEVVEEYEDRTVRSVTLEFRMPSVIRFLRLVRGRKRAIKFSRENVYARDKGRCQYCGQLVARTEFTYDHVMPRRLSGHTCWENVVVCCTACNQKKGGRTPQEAGLSLVAAPVRPKALPDVLRLTFTWQKGMPISWKSWLRDVAYWHGELENDNDPQ
jgi:5-methylcytosine-specific restriction endonuclease McrA